MTTFEVLAQIFRPRLLISVKEASEVVGAHYKTMYRPGYSVPKREIGGGIRVVHLGDLAKWIDDLKVVEGPDDNAIEVSVGRASDDSGGEASPLRRKRGRPRKSERLQS